MSAKPKQVTRLADYTPPAYLVDEIFLELLLREEETHVRARLHMRRNPLVEPSPESLRLDGRDLELLTIQLDGVPLRSEQYLLDHEHLVIPRVPDRFVLETLTCIHPHQNLSLEGLYGSRGLLCTQCEAEGFRKITFYPDRPDVMARFTVRIEADQSAYPVLLSNGNRIDAGMLPENRHYVVWEDPFPKPSYLFAVVAGRLACHAGTFTTASGRSVDLQIWVEPENIDRCQHALDSLKQAMRWDEERFGCEYDLDLYMIVAVNDFNSGAMENKGLNIFNAQYVLADPLLATDANYEEITSVIAHEYLHNWTGNRITCRDWFQLSLKEGLTIFRDQEFSSDLGSRPVQRIRDVLRLRAAQFPEDAGPTAHPVRPASYMEINNFYTATVYHKGAEVVRMLQTLVGRECFRRGMDLYRQRHDGQAVTVEDFVCAMEAVSGRDLGLFQRWYRQAGTPELSVQRSFDEQAGALQLTVTQHCRVHGQQEPGAPLTIPVTLALLDPVSKTPWPVALPGEDPLTAPRERVMELTRTEETWRFIGLPKAPIPSLLRGFSAPVRWKTTLSDEELAFLWEADTDPFNRWNAGQQLAMRVLLSLARRPDDSVPDSFVAAFGATLHAADLDPALKSLAISVPGMSLLIDAMEAADPAALFAGRERVRHTLAERYREGLWAVYATHQTPGPYRLDPADMGRRALKNAVLALLLALPGEERAAQVAAEQVRQADNMTDLMGGLVPLVHAGRIEAVSLLAMLEQRWRQTPLAMDKWFAMQALAPVEQALEQVQRLMRHPAYDGRNPNRIRAVVGSFCHGNPTQFHALSGTGYRFLVGQIRDLDGYNPQMAARLVTALSRWRHFESRRSSAMRAALEEIVALPGLSRNSYEIVSKSLV
ncbi:MAG: aminopeptidase N [Magnetococcales bacterium]|nr:aminopeptidase N [Magnetococcales bacterium]NGZ06677.1 aminopeptidase N [Magnetococcales bacterium]